jgi:hypothetical protein
MRYPVVNLGARRMGGMLEDYQDEINNLKAKIYHPTTSQKNPYAEPPAPPRVPTAPAPRVPNPIQPGMPVPPLSVSTGYLTPPGPVPAQPPSPYTPPSSGCPSGTTWTPTGCLPNVATISRYPSRYPAPSPLPEPIEPGMPSPPVSVATGYPTPPPTSQPIPPEPVPSVECEPGWTMTPAGCRKNVVTPSRLPGIPGGLFSGGEAGLPIPGLSGIRLSPAYRYEGPLLARSIRIAGRPW